MPSKLDMLTNKTDPTKLLKMRKETVKKVPEMMDVLRKDPRALEIFLDELALADQT